MAALLSRRLSAKSKLLHPTISSCFSIHLYSSSNSSLPPPDLTLHKPYLLNLVKFSPNSSIAGGSTPIGKPYQSPRFISSAQINEPDAKQEEKPKDEFEGFKHQEIEGPTVERDLSSLANETREVMEKLMKNMCSVSRVMGIMCVAQLGLGAWISYATKSAPVPEMTVMTAVAFGFPLSMALMLRSNVKSMRFYCKMEEIGRLQILTSTMQMAKQLNLFFFRLQGVSYLCVAGLSIGTLVLAFAR